MKNLGKEFYTSNLELKYKTGEIEVYIGSNCTAMTYTSKRQSKPKTHFMFKSDEQRTAYIQKFVKEQLELSEKKAKAKAEKKEAQASFVQPYKVGDILYSSWGYNQTNVDFFQVIACTKKSVTLQTIHGFVSDKAGYCGMSDFVEPTKDSFTNEKPFQARVSLLGSVKIHSFAYARAYDGQPKYRSWYA